MLNPVQKVPLLDYARNRQYEATYTVQGETVSISFGYEVFQRLGSEIKGLEGSSWHPETKTWKFKHPRYSQRNANVLGYLTAGKFPGSNPNTFERYSPKTPLINVTPNRDILQIHQRELLNKLVTYRRFMAAHDMGLGKSLVLIELMEYLLREHKVPNQDMWLIAPLAPLRSWQYELYKWKSKCYPILISCSHQAIRTRMDEAPYPPRLLIIDESSRFKNKSAQRTQLVLELRRLMAEAYYDNYWIVTATGTPAPNDPTDWHSQIEILCPGFIKEKDANQLRLRLADTEKREGIHGSYSHTLGWRVNELDSFYRRLKPIVDVKFKKDCLDLPPKIYQRLYCPVTDETIRAARLIIDTSTSVLEATQKLRQYSDGFQYDVVDPNGEYPLINRSKVNILIEELDTLKEEGKTRVVVYGSYRASVDIIVKTCLENGWNVIRVDGRGWQAFNLEGNKIEASMLQFQDLDLNLPIAFVANADSGSMGLTLTASQVTYFYSNSTKAENRHQAEERIYRIGTKGALIKDILNLPTDEQALDKLLRKKDMQDVTMGELKAVLEKGYTINESVVL